MLSPCSSAEKVHCYILSGSSVWQCVRKALKESLSFRVYGTENLVKMVYTERSLGLSSHCPEVECLQEIQQLKNITKDMNLSFSFSTILSTQLVPIDLSPRSQYGCISFRHRIFLQSYLELRKGTMDICKENLFQELPKDLFSCLTGQNCIKWPILKQVVSQIQVVAQTIRILLSLPCWEEAPYSEHMVERKVNNGTKCVSTSNEDVCVRVCACVQVQGDWL